MSATIIIVIALFVFSLGAGILLGSFCRPGLVETDQPPTIVQWVGLALVIIGAGTLIYLIPSK